MRLARHAVILLAIGVGGCAANGPYRHATDDYISPRLEADCQPLFASTDDEIRSHATNFALDDDERNAFLGHMHDEIDATPQNLKRCWETAYEEHADYDLYYAEFDDAGEATDQARAGIPYEKSQLHLIESRILEQLKDEPSAGFNIVVFTHGWHGTARADDGYSTEFKGILLDIADLEQRYRTKLAQSPGTAAVRRLAHRVLGIEIAWRGDSFLNPPIIAADTKNALNVWDRKNAAATISTGATQELLAFLNEIYLDNSCHGVERNFQSTGQPCDRVHLLSIGHSYGALINFQALIPRLNSGINTKLCDRAYGYGDMTVLVNPAFEGARYRALFRNAINRKWLIGPYYGDIPQGTVCPPSSAGVKPGVQIPTLVTFQSEGDSATEFYFPWLQRITSPFANTGSDTEREDKNKAIGWVDDFRTHALTEADGGADECLPKSGDPSATDETRFYCPFGSNDENALAVGPKPMHLTWMPGTPGLPNYMPLWSVAVATSIMKNHNDIWNPQIMRLISLLFVDAYEQTETLHGE